MLVRAADGAINEVADVFAARRIRQSDSLANLGFNALFGAALYGVHAVDAIESARKGGPVVEIAADDLSAMAGQSPSLRLVRIARQCAHRESLLTQVAQNGVALLSVSSRHQAETDV